METNLTTHSRLCASPHQVSTNVVDEVVILELQEGMYYNLDPVAARIWELLQAPTTFSAVEQAILSEYEVEPDKCREDLLNLLADLNSHGLIDVTPGP